MSGSVLKKAFGFLCPSGSLTRTQNRNMINPTHAKPATPYAFQRVHEDRLLGQTKMMATVTPFVLPTMKKLAAHR